MPFQGSIIFRVRLSTQWGTVKGFHPRASSCLYTLLLLAKHRHARDILAYLPPPLTSIAWKNIYSTGLGNLEKETNKIFNGYGANAIKL